MNIEKFKQKVDLVKYPVLNMDINQKDYLEIETILAKNMFTYLSYIKTKLKAKK